MNADYLLQPPEPITDTEAELWCDKCERDTWHRVVAWTRATAEAVCQVCGNETELEDDDE